MKSVGMWRWLLASLVVVGCAAVLARVALFRPRIDAPRDELLVQELRPARPLTLRVPAGIERLAVTSWAVVPPAPGHDPLATWAWALDLHLLDAKGSRVGVRRIETYGHISGDPRAEGGGWAARLADGGGWVTDPRTAVVEIESLVSTGGLFRIELRPGAVDRVLVRVSHRDARTRIGRELAELALDDGQRRRLVEGRTSLGFFDLPEPSRHRALAHDSRRLGAIGREGHDYFNRRLLVGDYRTSLTFPVPRSLGIEVGPHRAAALCFGRPVVLRLHGPPSLRLRAREGGGPAHELTLGAGGHADVDLAGSTPRTVVVEGLGANDARVSFTIRPDGAQAIIGAVPSLWLPDGRIEIGPDVRRHRCIRLDPADPVAVRIAPGQDALGLTVRGELAQSGATTELEGTIEARWDRGSIRRSVRLRRSPFDRFLEGGDATDPATVVWRVAPDVTGVRLFGPRAFCVRPWVLEPGVVEERIAPPYRIALPEGQRFRNAPWDIRDRTPIRAVDEAELVTRGRGAQVLAQVRIETVAGSGSSGDRAADERVLEPEGVPIGRELLVSGALAPGAPMPGDAWTELAGARARRVVVAARGPHARRLDLTWRASPDRLGGQARLRVDGVIAAEWRITLSSGTATSRVAPGPHDLLLEGLGEEGVGWVDAAPAGGGRILRRRPVYELSAMSPLDFAVDGRGRAVALLLAVEEPTWSLWSSIDGATSATTGLSECAPGAAGLLRGRAGDEGRATFREAPSLVGLSRVRIPLCDDGRPGRRVLRLRAARGDTRRVWVRAVELGASPDPAADDARSWAAEVP